MLATFSRFDTSSRTRAGSFPPSSRQSGVRVLAADEATWCATGREPMNVICDMPGWEVRWEAVWGQQRMGWIRLGECPQATRAALAIEA